MLVSTTRADINLGGIVKDSKFYIEVAKFVQAYTTIVENPNEFLQELNQEPIDEKKDKLSWAQFVNIVQKCDLGFSQVPTGEELVVYYNYALQIGSISEKEKRLATVDDVADAQKQYYNFVDDATDRAQTEYLRQKRVTQMREEEMSSVDGKLSALKAKTYLSFTMMVLAVAGFVFGLVSLFWANTVANAIGSIIPIWERNYIGGILIAIICVLIFMLFNKFYLKTKEEYLNLNMATITIFARGDESYLMEIQLKKKLDELKKDLKIVKAEIADKNKKYDVLANIERLKKTNKYYLKLCEELETALNTGDEKSLKVEDFAPVKLTKEQEENLRTVSKEAIRLEGEIDLEAYNEKFENITKFLEEADEQKKESEEKQEEDELVQSVDLMKRLFGITDEDLNQEKIMEEKEK